MDWQTIIVALIILAASFFVARRVWSRIRSMNAKGDSCETGCGKCGTTAATQRNTKSLVQLSSGINKKSVN